ncbi:potassium transporter TrkH [Myxococcota bacterium]|nr:potassium transporter TrkH [Myxococcota bacterium]
MPALLAAAGVTTTVAWPLGGGALPFPLHAGLAALSGAALLLAAVAELRRDRAGTRAMVGTGATLGTVLALAQRPEAPGRGLVLMLAAGMLVAGVLDLWGEGDAPGAAAGRPPARELPVAALAVMLGGVALLDADRVGLDRRWAAGAAAVVLVGAAVVDWRRGRSRWAPAALTALLGALALGVAGLGGDGAVRALVALLGPAALVASAVRAPEEGARLIGDYVLSSPARAMVVGFAALCTVGAVLLSLPLAAEQGRVALIDAAFTAVSAACVTGLGVVDTPGTFSFAGELLILLLIQVGGLGIMTFASAAAVFLGQRLSLSQERATADMLGPGARGDLRGSLRVVLLVTAVTELAGALLLTPSFLLRGDDLPTALWRALFTSISAFCNAGFALQSDSLVGYAGAPDVVLVVSLLIVLGGLGPPVVVALPTLLRGRGSLQGKLVLVTTALLLVVPALLYAGLEWRASLAPLSTGDKLVNAWFQSVTLRTAGFNSVDLTQVTPATWSLMVMAMFIGGSPGSTAGGLKTTTLAVLILAVVAAVRGRAEALAFGRRLPHRTVYEAAAIASAGLLAVIGALMLLQITQPIPLDRALFEVVSALATVGLTVGATAELDSVGKIIIMGCMFAGRVGPLTLFVFLAERQGDHLGPRPPIEAVPVG